MSVQSVTSGFRHDMEELFSRFLTPEESTEEMITDKTTKNISLRFSRFSGIWRQMNFSFVFRHRMNEKDLREFVEEIYLLVLPNVGSEYPYERRVSALYLLYSLFVKQPKNICQKIRINFSYLEQFRDLTERSKQLDQLDVCFVWYKLLSFGAIDVVVVSRQIGPNFIQNIRVTTGPQTTTDFLTDQFKTSIYFPFNELSMIHEKYQTLKEEMSEDIPEISKHCNAVKENIFDKNKSMADKMLKTIAVKASHKRTATSAPQMNDSEDSNGTNENKAPDIGSKRRQLKERSLHSKSNKEDTKIVRKYGPKQTLNGKPKGKRGRPKVARWISQDF